MPHLNKTSSNVIESTVTAFLQIRLTKEDVVVRLSISSLRLNFSVANGNSLPTASFDVPLGTLVYVGDRCLAGGASKEFDVAKILPRLSDTDIVEAWAKFDGFESPDTAWPSGYHMIWRGYFSTVAYAQDSSNLACRINSIHWLKDIISGSMVSADLTRAGYDDYLSASRMQTLTGAGLVSLKSLAEIAKIASGTGGRENGAQAEMWFTVLLPLLTSLMSPDSLTPAGAGLSPKSIMFRTLEKFANTPCVSEAAKEAALSTSGLVGNLYALSTLLGVDITGLSDEAKKASLFNVIKGRGTTNIVRDAAVTNECQITSDQMYNRPIGFNNEVEIIAGDLRLIRYTNPKIISNFCDHAAYLLAGQLGSSCAYDKIITAGEAFIFSLVPNVRSATLAPLIPTAPIANSWRTIKGDDILGFSTPAVEFPETWSGVALVGGEAQEQTTNQKNGSGKPGELSGVYVGQPFGKLHIAEAPPWVRYSAKIPREDGRRGAEGLYAATGLTYVPEEIQEFQQLGCDFSRAFWALHNFNHRQVSLRTRLRFDIAPGSHLIIEGIRLTNIETSSGQVPPRLAGVTTGVSISIDIANATAYTELQLSHLHSDEDEELGLIPPAHPIYDGVPWSGSPLVRLRDSDMSPKLS